MVFRLRFLAYFRKNLKLYKKKLFVGDSAIISILAD